MIRNAQSGLLDYRAPMGSRVNLPHSPHFLSDSELRPLCSTIVTRFTATTGLSATRADPACPSRASGWGLSPRLLGLPVLPLLPLPTCQRQYPGASAWCFCYSLPNQTAAFAYSELARQSHCLFRGLLDVQFSFWPVCSLIRPSPNLLHQRLRALPLLAVHAPVTSGWSSSCRVGYLPPTGRARSFHGALGFWV